MNVSIKTADVKCLVCDSSLCSRADYFVLVLDVLNVSPDPLQLTCVAHSKSTIVIPTQQSSR